MKKMFKRFLLVFMDRTAYPALPAAATNQDDQETYWFVINFFANAKLPKLTLFHSSDLGSTRYAQKGSWVGSSTFYLSGSITLGPKPFSYSTRTITRISFAASKT